MLKALLGCMKLLLKVFPHVDIDTQLLYMGLVILAKLMELGTKIGDLAKCYLRHIPRASLGRHNLRRKLRQMRCSSCLNGRSSGSGSLGKCLKLTVQRSPNWLCDLLSQLLRLTGHKVCDRNWDLGWLLLLPEKGMNTTGTGHEGKDADEEC
jgi:hypothetical protein